MKKIIAFALVELLAWASLFYVNWQVALPIFIIFWMCNLSVED